MQQLNCSVLVIYVIANAMDWISSLNLMHYPLFPSVGMVSFNEVLNGILSWRHKSLYPPAHVDVELYI